MKKKMLTAATAAVFVLAAALGASAATHKKASSTAKGHAASGSIEQYDATGRTLTLKTATGSQVFSLSADAKVWAGARSVTADDLTKDIGSKATVRYTESGGQKTATSVRVSAAKSKTK
jgi:hypothetical protein